MHSIARESLQNYLYSYKETPKEPGLPLIRDAKKSQAFFKICEERRARKALKEAVACKVSFAVQCHVSYDGSLENECPIHEKVVSYQKNDFIHVYKKFNHDWWIGRIVAVGSTIGFVPTARRLYRLKEIVDTEESPTHISKSSSRQAIKPKGRFRSSSTPATAAARAAAATVSAKQRLVRSQSPVWELPCPYTVVPSTRPIVLMGPCNQSCRLTELMHSAVVSAIVKQFGSRVCRLPTEIGAKGLSKQEYDLNERELRLITSLADDLRLVLLDSPNLNTPPEVNGLQLAPIIILFRIKNRKILIKLLKKSVSVGQKLGGYLATADYLNTIHNDKVNLLIEDNGLPEAIKKITNYLEDYWKALHPAHPLLEEEYMRNSC
ncbi:unnamed protein product [Auanema sp. JU1783]|nr:unnamed protein product [Auanema sp. JU1783]